MSTSAPLRTPSWCRIDASATFDTARRVTLRRLFAVLLSLIVIGVSGCAAAAPESTPDTRSVVGKWSVQYGPTEIQTWEFREDGTYSSTDDQGGGYEGTYTVEGELMTLLIDDRGEPLRATIRWTSDDSFDLDRGGVTPFTRLE